MRNEHACIASCQVHIVRVPTDENIADNPSRHAGIAIQLRAAETAHNARESYTLLSRIGAKVVEASLDERYLDAKTWEALSLRFSVHGQPGLPDKDQSSA